MTLLLAIVVLIVQFVSFVLYIPHITLSNDLSSQKEISRLIAWGLIYISPLVGSIIIYLVKKKLRDPLTFLVAIIVLDGIAILLPVAFHWLYWLIY